MKNIAWRIIKRLLLVSTILPISELLIACTPTPSPPPFVCEDAIGCVTIAPGAPIKFGALYTLSGGSSPGGIEQARAVELTLSKRDNQLLGHPIELQTLDERCSSEGGRMGALRLVADPQRIAIFGTNCSSAAIAAGELISEAGLVMISGANSAPSLTAINGERGEHWQAGYFRTAWVDTVMGHEAAIFAYQELGIKQAAVVHGGDAYTKGLVDTFTKTFTDLGGHIVQALTIDEDDTNHRPMLEAVALSQAELLYFPLSYPESSGRLIQQAKAMPALENLIFIGSEGMLSEAFINTVGDAGIGVYLPGPAPLHSPENDALRADYEAMFGKAPPAFYYSFTYDAVNILLNAIETVAIQDHNGAHHIGRQALRDALYATQDYAGLTGTLSCDEFGDCGAAQFNMVRLDNLADGVNGLRKNVVYTHLP